MFDYKDAKQSFQNLCSMIVSSWASFQNVMITFKQMGTHLFFIFAKYRTKSSLIITKPLWISVLCLLFELSPKFKGVLLTHEHIFIKDTGNLYVLLHIQG